MTFQSDLLADARGYLSDHYGIDLSTTPVDAVQLFVNELYPGGWLAYERNFRRFMAKVQPQAENYSPIKVRAIVGNFTKRLCEHDEVISFHFIPKQSATFVVSRATEIEETTRRDIVTERELVLTQLTWTDEGWEKKEVRMVEAVREVHHRFGRLNTPDRVASDREQYETCYRPGTKASPRKGWIARLEVSWKEAHANETFPITKGE